MPVRDALPAVLRGEVGADLSASARAELETLAHDAQQEKRLQQNTADAARNRELKNSDANPSAGSKSDAAKAMSFQQAEKAKQMARDQQQMTAKVGKTCWAIS